MMFKGTSKYGPSILSKIVQKNGGTDNAYTTKDYTVYFELFSSDRINLSIDLEADRMQNLTIDPKEMISERSVVMEERRLRYEDDPQSSLFEEIESGPARKNITSTEPEQRGEKRVFLKREAELPYILIAYHTPIFPDEDSYALDVLSLILSGGKSSRLYQSLVYEKKISLSASADYSGFNKDPYLFFFSATASPGKSIKDVEDSLYVEIEKIKTKLPSEREIQKAKNQIESSFIMEQDSIYMQAMKYGMFEMLGGWKLIDRYLEGVRKVTPEDVVKVAKKYLKEDNRTVGILIPTKEVKSEQ